VVTVIGARQGLGATSVVVNLAAALAHARKQVLILDENLSHDNVANVLALKPRFDLLNAVRDDMTWREIVLQTPGGVSVMPVARAMQALPKLSETESGRMLQGLTAATRRTDLILVDATPDGQSLCASLSGNEPIILVLNATVGGITDTYALLKKMAAIHGRHTFDLVVNKARDEEEAQNVFENMAQVARHHLKIELKYLGNIPQDENLNMAMQLHRPIVDLYPDSPAADAFVELARNLMLLSSSTQSGSNSFNNLLQRLLQREPVIHQQKSGQRVVHAVR
jgi:flagellar biosynthesis protein FlhG